MTRDGVGNRDNLVLERLCERTANISLHLGARAAQACLNDTRDQTTSEHADKGKPPIC